MLFRFFIKLFEKPNLVKRFFLLNKFEKKTALQKRIKFIFYTNKIYTPKSNNTDKNTRRATDRTKII